jgi:hypothetical protein
VSDGLRTSGSRACPLSGADRVGSNSVKEPRERLARPTASHTKSYFRRACYRGGIECTVTVMRHRNAEDICEGCIIDIDMIERRGVEYGDFGVRHLQAVARSGRRGRTSRHSIGDNSADGLADDVRKRCKQVRSRRPSQKIRIPHPGRRSPVPPCSGYRRQPGCSHGWAGWI